MDIASSNGIDEEFIIVGMMMFLPIWLLLKFRCFRFRKTPIFSGMEAILFSERSMCRST